MRGLRELPARVLANRPLEAAGEVFKRESATSKHCVYVNCHKNTDFGVFFCFGALMA